jgi:CHAD domain-containing protein
MGNYTAAIEQTLTQWRDARRRVLRRHAGQSSVHAWRIAARRLFAIEQLLAPATATRRNATVRKTLRGAFDASGKLRDTQLAICHLESLAPEFPAAARLVRHLQRRLPKQRRLVTDRIRDIKPRELRRVAAAWNGAGAPHFDQATRLRALHRLSEAEHVLQGSMRRNGTAASIHRQRIQLKSLRYMTELHCAAGGAAPRSTRLLRLTGRQDQLGRITDLQMLLKSMERYGSRHRRWLQEAAPLRRHVQRQRRQLLNQLNAGAGSAPPK